MTMNRCGMCEDIVNVERPAQRDINDRRYQDVMGER